MCNRSALLQEILPSGTVIVSDMQTAGRGRGGNSWLSPGGSLSFSLLVKTASSAISQQICLQHLMALALVTSIKRRMRSVCDVRIKWPNDVYVSTKQQSKDGFIFDSRRYRKVAGILTTTSASGSMCYLIFGTFPCFLTRSITLILLR